MDIDRLKAVLVNGRQQEVVSACDRGLLYGDGVFETLAVKNGQALEFVWHLERLALGCRRLAIPCPAEEVLQREVDQLCTGQTRAILKIIVTRGTGARGYLAPRKPEVTRILCLSPWSDFPARFYREGVRVRRCQQRLCDNPALTGIKHLNRLEQVMARNEWHYPEVAEGLMCDYADNLIEATASNIFIVDAGILQTPDLSKAGIEGVMRRRILQLAQDTGIKNQILPIPLQKLEDADEIFLCNSLIGIWPVRQIGKMRFGVGRITRRLLHAVEPYCAIDIRVPT
jgi:4-amino-4-deoxychorismate lyase